MRSGSPILHRSFRTAALVAALVALLGSSVALAQSPSYQTKPRSGGGRAAQFGGAARPGSRTAPRGNNGAPPPVAGAQIQPPARGAARPSVGSPVPNSPLMGAGAAPGRRSYGAAGGIAGPQVFTKDQLKSGGAGGPGIVRPSR